MIVAMKERVVVAMSGGVDSSVSAALLVEQGYEVIGLMMRLWSEEGMATSRDNRCCTRDQMIDAALVARKLKIPFEMVDVRETFKTAIVDFFVQGYTEGVTPNPCLACNREIRFTALLNEALKRGARYLATGHYAQATQTPDGIYQLRKGADPNKDQSYVLSVLNQHQLSHALFPVGGYVKTEVRSLAERFGLRVARKSDSQDLCFVADGNYRRFMREAAPAAFVSGPIMTRQGAVLGEHTGLANYTIGQRKGLGITAPEPMYVIDKQPERNALIVGMRSELGSTTFSAVRMNWMSGTVPNSPIEATVKIRYKASPVPARVTPEGPFRIRVELNEPAPDITPGQGAVLYQGDVVLGCGLITSPAHN